MYGINSHELNDGSSGTDNSSNDSQCKGSRSNAWRLYFQVETQAGKQYITLTDYKGKEEKITLPEAINGIEVTSVQSGFGKNSNLKSITFSKNIRKNLTALSDISTLEGNSGIKKIIQHIRQKMEFFIQKIKRTACLSKV